MATHAGILAWGIPMVRGAWQATVLGVMKESDTIELLSLFSFKNAFLLILKYFPFPFIF